LNNPRLYLFMRLSTFQRKTIKEVVLSVFGKDSILYLFGSRMDDNKRGGDIDLLISVPGSIENREQKKLEALSKIQLSLGDQKIDMVIAEQGMENPPLIVSEALKGVAL